MIGQRVTWMDRIWMTILIFDHEGDKSCNFSTAILCDSEMRGVTGGAILIKHRGMRGVTEGAVLEGYYTPVIELFTPRHQSSDV